MPNSIAFAKTYIPIIDEVYQNASVSRVLTSGGRIVRSTHNAKVVGSNPAPATKINA